MGSAKKIDNDRPIIICLTPVKNELWILDLFLKCTSIWADYIIIADQNSNDGSKEIAYNYEKVILINNNNTEYNEVERQRLLLEKARSFSGKKLLITLDADEFFCSGFSETEEWKVMLNGQPGDSFAFRWINILPGYERGWISTHFIWAMIDDNSGHYGNFIHNHRLPIKDKTKTHYFEQIRVLHYQYTNWQRMESKQRYYQCLERIKQPQIIALDLFRKYHHMYNLKKESIIDLDNRLFFDYENLGYDMKPKLSENEFYWFDKEVLFFLNQYHPKKFRKEVIWNINWGRLASEMVNIEIAVIKDPRNIFDKLVHFWLNSTKGLYNSMIVIKIDKIIKNIW